MTKHFGKTVVFGSRMAIHLCSGRAVDNIFSITDDPCAVTCKRCVKKMDAARLEAVD